MGGTLGVGNITGVCAAIAVGGPGCVFWIWICAIFSAITKYTETALAVMYRNSNGGGAHSYIKNGLGLKKLAAFFCALCILTSFTLGNVTQVKASADFSLYTIGIPRYVTAVAFLLAVFIVCIGKGKRISGFTSSVVPILCSVYTVLCIILIVGYRENIPSVTARIFNEAFSFRSAGSGALAAIFSPTVRLGVTRGLTSNEAGCGTAPISYASDPCALPVSSGMLGAAEVLIDTLLLCTLTAYAVLLPEVSFEQGSAKAITEAITLSVGNIARPILCASVFLFALASVCAWSFYAIKSAEALGLKRSFFVFYSAAYPLTAFFGCFASEGGSWIAADLTVSAMAIINTVCVGALFGKVVDLTKREYQKLTSAQSLKH